MVDNEYACIGPSRWCLSRTPPLLIVLLPRNLRLIALLPCNLPLHSFLLYDCHVGWPGSSGDSTVWASRPYQHGPSGLAMGDPSTVRGGFLLPYHFLMGDGGYTISTATACAGRLDRVYFNYKQSKARR